MAEAEHPATQKDLDGLLQWLWIERERLPMFVVYDRSTEAAPRFEAQLWWTLPENRLTGYFISSPDLDKLNDTLADLGLTPLAPSPQDEPSIRMVWMA